MKKLKSSTKGFILGILSTLAVLGVAFTAWNWDYLIHKEVSPANIGGVGKVAAITQKIGSVYLGDVDQEKLTDYMCLGLVTGLEDKYSTYYTQEQYEKIQQSNAGHYLGLGLVIEQESAGADIVVGECKAGSPAAKAGIQAGDILRVVDNQSVEGLTNSQVVEIIGKKTEGDYVTLTVQRGEETFTAEIEISDIENVSATGKMIENQVGYIQITEFTAVTAEQFETSFRMLQDQGMEKLIIDLRSNPGGLVIGVCDTLRQILPEGLIVYTEDKNGRRSEEWCEGETPIDIPLAVLVNGSSASASEIFAGAVQDYGIGTIVGTTTFGKGVVQDTFPLSGGGAVKLTISHYFTPDGNDINGKGIAPDVEVQQPEDAKEDQQLKKAQEILQK